MSTTIDERVVEMRFDNRQFEQNVSSTMTVLDKLKQSLRFKDAEQGFDNLDKASKKVDMTHIGKGIETVQAKFSALEIMGTTALVNLTNSAVNAGKRIASALTIDPVKSGFQEYETQINAVQTILANTSSKGTTLEDVNSALDDLNKYADKTIYNFTEMTRNIGTFTAAGVDLDTSVKAIKGIANLAAVSGSTSQQASTAMYQLSQALSSGTVKLMDWNSVVNAGMGGEVFQNALKETARLHKVKIDQMIKSEGSFRETLKDGWLTSEILTETLEKFTLCVEDAEVGTAEYTKQWNELKASLMKKGYTAAQAEEILKMGTTATDAATKVKTFTQLMDTLKEAVQSGWTQTWEIVFGDFNEAKKLFSDISDFLGGIIGGISDARNKFLEAALGSPFQGLADKLNAYSESLEKLKINVGYYQDVVNKVWRGDYDNGKPRVGLLEKAGYDYKVIQSLVNKGYQYKLTMEDVVEAETKYGDASKVAQKSTTDLSKTILELSKEELRNLGLTEEEIDLFKDLAKESKKTGVPIMELIENMGNLDGRTMLFESFGILGRNLITVFQSIGKAWNEVFPPKPIGVYNFIRAFYEVVKSIEMTDKNADHLKRTFKGIFALLDIILTIVGGPIKLIFKIIAELIKANNIDIFALTARIGDAIVAFRDFLDSVYDFSIIFEGIIPVIKKVAGAIWDWVTSLKDSDNIARDIILGLVNGLGSGIATVIGVIYKIGVYIIDTIKDVLGIHSPSTEFFEIGKNVIEGFVNGVKAFGSKAWEIIRSVCSVIVDIVKEYGPPVWNFVKEVGIKVINEIKKIDIGTAIAGVIVLGTISALNKVADALGSFGDLMDNVGKGVADFGKGVKAAGKGFKNYMDSKALVNMAIAIGILAASIYLIAKMDEASLQKGIITIVALAGAVLILGAAARVITAGGAGTQMIQLAAMMVSISLAVLLLTAAMKNLGSISPAELENIMSGLEVALIALAGVLLTTRLAGKNAKGLGGTLVSLTVGMLAMLGLIKICAKMDVNDIFQGYACVLATGLLIRLLTTLTKSAKKCKGSGTAILGVTAGMLAMLALIAICGKMNPDTFDTGYKCVFSLGIMIALLMKLCKQKDMKGLASSLLSMSAAIAILAGLCLVLGLVNKETLDQGVTIMAALSLMMYALLKVSKNKKNVTSATSTIVALTVAIAALSALVIILGSISEETAIQGLAIVSTLLVEIGALIVIMSTFGDGMSLGDILKNLIFVGLLMVEIAALVKYLSTIENVEATALVLVGIGALLTEMGASLAILNTFCDNGMELGDVIKVLVTMGLMYLEVAALIAILAQIEGVEEVAPVLPLIGAMLVEVSSAAAILGGAVKLISKAAPAITPMSIVLAGFAVLAAAAGALLKVDGVKDIVNGGIDFLCTLAEGIGKFIGSLIGGIAEGLINAVVNTLPNLGTALSDFSDNAQGFMTGIKNVDSDTLGNIGIITGAIALLVAADVLESIGSFLGGGFEDLGTQLSTFITGAVTGLNALEGVDEDAVSAVGSLADAILTLTGADLMSAITSFIGGGESDIGKFGTQLADFGTGLVGFVDAMSGLTDEDLALCEAGAGAIKIFAEAAKEIPNEGGWAGKIFGENGIAQFAEQVAATGTCLADFIKNINRDGDFGEAQVLVAQKAADVIGNFAKVAKDIPNSGGWAGKIFGENGLAAFADEVAITGTCLADFIVNINRDGTFGETQVAVAEKAAGVIKTFADVASNIPNSGGWAAEIFGDNSLAAFADEVAITGTCLADFISNIGTFGETEVVTAGLAAGVISAFAAAADGIPNSGGWAAAIFGENSLSAFADEVADTGTALGSFITNIGTFGETEVNTALCGVSVIKGFADTAKNLPDTSNAIKNFLTGDYKLKDFVKECIPIGGHLKDLVGKMKGVDTNKLDSAVKMLSSLATLANLGTKKDAGKTFTEFIGDITDGLDSVVTCCRDLINNNVYIANGVAKLDTFIGDLEAVLPTSDSEFMTKATNFSNAMYNIASQGVDLFVSMTSAENSVTSLVDALNALVIGATGVGFSIETTNALENLGATVVTNISAGISDNKQYHIIDPMKTLFTSTIPTAIKSTTVAQACKEIGAYIVQGIATGISDNTYLATNAATTMANDVLTGTQDALGIQSPSKKTYIFGNYVVQGLVNGISNNAGDIQEASKNMGEILLNGTKDFLQIDSGPSLVFDKSVGRYIVQGIAQGIEKDMSAEDAIEQKVSNVTSAFQKAFESLDLQSDAIDKELQYWLSTDGFDASEYEQLVRQAEASSAKLQLATAKTGLAFDKYQNAIANNFSKKVIQEFYNEWINLATEEANLRNEINQLYKDAAEKEKATLRELAAIERSIKEGRAEHTLSSMEQEAIKLTHLNEELVEIKTDYMASYNEYLEVVKKFGEDSKEAQAAKLAYLQKEDEIVQKESEIIQAEQANLDALKDLEETRKEISSTRRETSKTIIEREYGELERGPKMLEFLNKDLADLEQEYTDLEHEYWRIVTKYGEESKEAADALLALDNKNQEIVDVKYAIEDQQDAIRETQEEYEDLVKTNTDLEKDIMLSRSTLGASETEKDTLELSNLNNKLADGKLKYEELTQAYLDAVAKYTDKSIEAQTARQAMLDQEKANFQTEQEILAKEDEIVEKRKTRDDEIRDLDYEYWEQTEGRDATEYEKNLKKDSHDIEVLMASITRDTEELNAAKSKWEEALSKYDANSNEVKEAESNYKHWQNVIQGYWNQIDDIQDAALKREEDAEAKRKDLMSKQRDSKYDQYLKTNALYYSEDEKYVMELKHLKEDRAELYDGLLELEQDYADTVEKYTANSNEAIEAWNKVLDQKNKILDKDIEIDDKEKEHLENKQETLKELQNLKNDKYDLEYQIWEATLGRDADDSEKELAQLEMLKKQYTVSTNLLSYAYSDYLAARETYAENSVEVQTAYNDYLQAQYDSVSLHNEILDIEESIAKREQDLIDQRNIDKKEYDDYIKTYKKYYLANGMTLEELEKDAQLISGYDPSDAVKKVVNSTSKALKSLSVNSVYTGTLKGMSDMGTTYVESFSEGMASGETDATKTVNDIASKCLEVVSTKLPEWITAGGQLISGLITGINDNKMSLFSVIGNIASSVINTVTSVFQINSPSKVFMEIGKYVDMGLANGLNKYSYLALDTASDLSDDVVSNVRNTIDSIVNAINSDIDSQPTIRPVLDMSDVKRGMSEFNASLSRSQASNISFDMNHAASAKFRMEEDGTTSNGGNTYNFNQYNTSPKALSSIEIYRQTRNQFAAAKEVLSSK